MFDNFSTCSDRMVVISLHSSFFNPTWIKYNIVKQTNFGAWLITDINALGGSQTRSSVHGSLELLKTFNKKNLKKQKQRLVP